MGDTSQSGGRLDLDPRDAVRAFAAVYDDSREAPHARRYIGA